MEEKIMKELQEISEKIKNPSYFQEGMIMGTSIDNIVANLTFPNGIIKVEINFDGTKDGFINQLREKIENVDRTELVNIHFVQIINNYEEEYEQDCDEKPTNEEILKEAEQLVDNSLMDSKQVVDELEKILKK